MKYLIILILILLLSCNSEPIYENFNLYGGIGRTNSYENIKTIYQRLVVTDTIQPIDDASGSISTPLVLDNGRFCLSSLKGYILLTTREKVLWNYKLGPEEVVTAGMCADINRNIYCASNKGIVYSFNIEGKLRWTFNIYDSIYDSVQMSDLLVVNDRIIVSADSGKIFSLDTNGRKIWERISSINSTRTFSADEKGNIALNLTFDEFNQTDTLLFLSKDGKELWKKSFNEIRLIKSPVIHKNKIFLIGIHTQNGERLSKIFVFDDDGNPIWEREISIFLRFISVDRNENIYLTGYNAGIGETISGIYCYSIEGNLKWRIYYEMSIPAPILIAKEFIAAVGMTRKAPGLYIMTKEGELSRTISLSDSPTLFLQPNISKDGNIVFASTEKLALVRIEETLLNKILPY